MSKHDKTNRRYELSLSAGHVYPDPATPITLETMIARADAEMYKQKRGTHRSGDPASKLCMDQEADLELPRAL